MFFFSQILFSDHLKIISISPLPSDFLDEIHVGKRACQNQPNPFKIEQVTFVAFIHSEKFYFSLKTKVATSCF